MTEVKNPVFTRRLSFLAGVFLIALVLIVLGNTIANAKTQETPHRTKYYKSIAIEEGDSLWSIAEEYITEEYDSTKEYVNELMSMNGLQNETIHTGSYLVVAYYAEPSDD